MALRKGLCFSRCLDSWKQKLAGLDLGCRAQQASNPTAGTSWWNPKELPPMLQTRDGAACVIVRWWLRKKVLQRHADTCTHLVYRARNMQRGSDKKKQTDPKKHIILNTHALRTYQEIQTYCFAWCPVSPFVQAAARHDKFVRNPKAINRCLKQLAMVLVCLAACYWKSRHRTVRRATKKSSHRNEPQCRNALGVPPSGACGCCFWVPTACFEAGSAPGVR